MVYCSNSVYISSSTCFPSVLYCRLYESSKHVLLVFMSSTPDYAIVTNLLTNLHSKLMHWPELRQSMTLYDLLFSHVTCHVMLCRSCQSVILVKNPVLDMICISSVAQVIVILLSKVICSATREWYCPVDASSVEISGYHQKEYVLTLWFRSFRFNRGSSFTW